MSDIKRTLDLITEYEQVDEGFMDLVKGGYNLGKAGVSKARELISRGKKVEPTQRVEPTSGPTTREPPPAIDGDDIPQVFRGRNDPKFTTAQQRGETPTPLPSQRDVALTSPTKQDYWRPTDLEAEFAKIRSQPPKPKISMKPGETMDQAIERAREAARREASLHGTGGNEPFIGQVDDAGSLIASAIRSAKGPGLSRAEQIAQAKAAGDWKKAQELSYDRLFYPAQHLKKEWPTYGTAGAIGAGGYAAYKSRDDIEKAITDLLWPPKDASAAKESVKEASSPDYNDPRNWEEVRTKDGVRREFKGQASDLPSPDAPRQLTRSQFQNMIYEPYYTQPGMSAPKPPPSAVRRILGGVVRSKPAWAAAAAAAATGALTSPGWVPPLLGIWEKGTPEGREKPSERLQRKADELRGEKPKSDDSQNLAPRPPVPPASGAGAPASTPEAPPVTTNAPGPDPAQSQLQRIRDRLKDQNESKISVKKYLNDYQKYIKDL